MVGRLARFAAGILHSFARCILRSPRVVPPPQSGVAPIPPRTIDWVRAEISDHLRRQLADADAADAKTGLFLAFIGAILVGGITLPHTSEVGRAFQIATVDLAVEALLLNLVALFPRNYHDPPDPESFADDLLGGREEEVSAIRQLVRTQLAAIKKNDVILRTKLMYQVGSGTFAVGATATLLLQAATA